MHTLMVTCPHCHAKNRIPAEKSDTPAKCGRCGQWLPVAETKTAQEDALTLRCGQCRSKNRVPMAKLHAGAKCGRCGASLEHQDVLSGRPVVISDANFIQSVMQAPLPVVMYAWAPWCSVCRGTGPMVEEFAKETKGKIRVAKLNVDTAPNLAARYNILSVPAFFIFDGGELKEHVPGAIAKHELMIKTAAYILR